MEKLKRCHGTVQTRAGSLSLHAHPETSFVQLKQALQWLRYSSIYHLLRVMHHSRIYLFLTLQQTRNFLHSLVKKLGKPRQSWRNCSLLTRTCCSSRESKYSSLHLRSQLPLTPAYFSLWAVYMWHTYRKRQVYTHTYIQRYPHTHIYTYALTHTHLNLQK